ncbi:MAG TPA: DUF6221 family protein [Jatrophihabitantaceae bacterium]
MLARLDEIEATASATHLPFRDHWRTGRKVGRTLYATETDTEDGHLIGTLDSPALAAHAATFDPAFVFRALAAWRRTAERHTPFDEDEIDTACQRCADGGRIDEDGSRLVWPCPEISDLAYALGIDPDGG